jgi:hypothetical protein
MAFIREWAPVTEGQAWAVGTFISNRPPRNRFQSGVGTDPDLPNVAAAKE